MAFSCKSQYFLQFKSALYLHINYLMSQYEPLGPYLIYLHTLLLLALGSEIKWILIVNTLDSFHMVMTVLGLVLNCLWLVTEYFYFKFLTICCQIHLKAPSYLFLLIIIDVKSLSSQFLFFQMDVLIKWLSLG